MWNGDYKFLLTNLIAKDFKIRYRNMSLGVFWSLLNPLVMMAVLTLVFTKFLPSSVPDFPVFVLIGIVTFNFFSTGWMIGAASMTDNAGLIKRVPVPREIMPVATVLSVFVHVILQIMLLISLILLYGKGVNVYWIWMPVLWSLLIVFVCGLAFLFSAINVYIRDTRYLVESATTVLFWVAPIFYPLTYIPEQYQGLYLSNPVSAVIVGSRNILLDGTAPPLMLIARLAAISLITLALGLIVFRSLKGRFYNYL
jgi:ABC-type polysaccharide/polyol phosphate export permease